MLQIFLEHQNKSKTSLLQDFAYYEVSLGFTDHIATRLTWQQLSAQRGQSPAPSMPHQVPTPPPIPPQFAMNMNMPLPGGAVPPVPPIPARFR